jgi:sarcosine oxidase
VTYDAIVLGVGGMGSAALLSLAKRGAKVLGIEQFALGHAKGSSHGGTRLIRKAYFEEERYVPLVHRAYELWDEAAAESGARLFHRTGLLVMEPGAGGDTLPRLLASAAKHAIPVETLTPAEIEKRFPWFHPPGDYRGVFEANAGYLEVEKGVAALAKLATARGAAIRTEETVVRWSAGRGGVSVTTDKGTYAAKKLVVTAGPWAGRVLSGLGLPLRVLRIPQLWFEAGPEWEETRGTPCFAFARPDGFIYGFPRLPGAGVKAAEYHPDGGEVGDPSAVDRNVYPADVKKIAACLAAYTRGIIPMPVASSVCMYTMTPDTNFVVDIHPEYADVAFAAGFSGHGFKFAPAVGEWLADLALEGRTGFPIGFLSVRRFG